MRTVAIVVAMLAATATAHAAEIIAFISTAIKAATDQLLPPFERANGYVIRASYAPSGALIPRFERGEPVDVFLTDSTLRLAPTRVPCTNRTSSTRRVQRARRTPPLSVI